MQNSLKNKSQSLPKLKSVGFRQKSYNLARLFVQQPSKINQSQSQIQNYDLNIIDPEQKRKQQVKQMLQKSKSMIQKNKDKIQVAKKFRLLNKKLSGPFLTGVDIYKQQQQQKCYNNELQQKDRNRQNENELKKLLSDNYDDLGQLRKMIRKTSKNLGAYKQQTLSIQKNLINMADRYGDVGMDVLNRKKIRSNVYEYKNQI